MSAHSQSFTNNISAEIRLTPRNLNSLLDTDNMDDSYDLKLPTMPPAPLSQSYAWRLAEIDLKNAEEERQATKNDFFTGKLAIPAAPLPVVETEVEEEPLSFSPEELREEAEMEALLAALPLEQLLVSQTVPDDTAAEIDEDAGDLAETETFAAGDDVAREQVSASGILPSFEKKKRDTETPKAARESRKAMRKARDAAARKLKLELSAHPELAKGSKVKRRIVRVIEDRGHQPSV